MHTERAFEEELEIHVVEMEEDVRLNINGNLLLGSIFIGKFA